MLNFCIYTVLISAQLLPLGSGSNSAERGERKWMAEHILSLRESRLQHTPFP